MSNADSGRIIHIAKQRERNKEDVEKHKLKLEKERESMKATIQTKFTTNVDKAEEQLKADTVGLVTLDKMKEKQMEILKKGDDIIIGKEGKESTSSGQEKTAKSDSRVAEKRFLSFGGFDDDEEEEESPPIVKKRLGMCPEVDSSFLPDQEREQALLKQKEELAKEWRELQEKEKNEEIDIAFGFYDGTLHRRDTKVKKGATISQFLQKAIDMFRKQFPELRTITTESLIFVKEDLIIPHFYTFQDFLASKPMGKTGPLWQFDAGGEIRLRQDAVSDCGESHPVKVVLRSWYERNKHIYPASRWEPFVANKIYQNNIDD